VSFPPKRLLALVGRAAIVIWDDACASLGALEEGELGKTAQQISCGFVREITDRTITLHMSTGEGAGGDGKDQLLTIPVAWCTSIVVLRSDFSFDLEAKVRVAARKSR